MGKSELSGGRLLPQQEVLILSPADNVAVALRALNKGSVFLVSNRRLTLADSIPPGHKVALKRIRKGSVVVKYGQPIGFATTEIRPGELVHVHNVTVRNYSYRRGSRARTSPARKTRGKQEQFSGFRRSHGGVGTRNYILVIATTNCSATACRRIADHFRAENLKSYPNVDGVVALTHKSGCGMQAGGLDYQVLQRTLAGYAQHPNVFDFVLVGLGCEVNQLSHLLRNQGLVSLNAATSTPEIVTIQDAGGLAPAVDAGVRAVERLLPQANECRRTAHSVVELIVGTECGGSDAYSGITANPALGIACDEIVCQGGTAVLAETPEIYGAEHLLLQRVRDKSVGKALLERIAWWERYAESLGAELNNNPTPGNLAGGLTTIYEKSLGAVAKGGNTILNAVYQYAEPIREKGLVVMDTPGHDPVSVTGMIAGGANVIVFTTGRGSVFGSVPVPSIKVATHSAVFQRMPDDMDLNAGPALEGQSVEDVGHAIFKKILQVASGEKTASERQGVGEEEFAPWAIGPVL